jgi:hypothetical protein
MATLDFKQTHSWQDAVELGARLVTLAEELPAHEQTGLVMQLQQLMLDLPAQVAADLIEGTRTRFQSIYRLASAFDLIERIYPALDTAAVHNEFELVVSRLESNGFSEAISAPNHSVVDLDDEEEAITEPLSSEPEAERETSFPISPSLSQVISTPPTAVPILGTPVVPPVVVPDISGLPEGIEMSNDDPLSDPLIGTLPVTQAVNVQPNSIQ